jgi:hypothetical protein
MSDSGPRYSRLVLTAGGLAILLLTVAGIRDITLPEWLSHLCISVAVVAIVHLLDRYVFVGETRDELGRLSHKIVTDVSKGTDAALGKLTTDLNSSVTERMERLLDDTRTSLNDILTSQSESLKAMARGGIRKLYASRGDASPAIAAALKHSSTGEIRILGISLNDFIRGDQPTLHAAWQDLKGFVMANQPVEPKRQLKIKLLLIDPDCAGATLRSYAESLGRDTEPGRLETDVRSAATALAALQAAAAKVHVSFECKLYRLAPTMFLCHIDEACFVQQYHFWTERLHETPIPVIEYDAHPPPGSYRMHHELRQHFDLIWDRASVDLVDFVKNACAGTEKAAGELGLDSVFTNRDQAAARMLCLLEGARKRVLIQGISLKSFFTGVSKVIPPKVLDLIAKADVEMQVLVLDPECHQAVYRSYRERLLQPQGRVTDFAAYKSSGQHQKSRLVTDTLDTLTSIDSWIQDLVSNNQKWRGKLDVRLYDSAPTCFMLAVDDRVLVEPYNYGKIGVRQQGVAAPTTLGTDMPLFEYRKSPSELYKGIADPLRNPYELLVDHFTFAFANAKTHQLGSLAMAPAIELPPLSVPEREGGSEAV